MLTHSLHSLAVFDTGALRHARWDDEEFVASIKHLSFFFVAALNFREMRAGGCIFWFGGGIDIITV
jgi:hypothetical protein